MGQNRINYLDSEAIELSGDFDGDGDVDGPDLSYFSDCFGSLAGESNFDQVADFDKNDRNVLMTKVSP
jgi:hypothetical protein